MPKIIENARNDILNTAKRHITENGYSKTTMRSIAAACGIAVGTLYNYFPSKDMLIATFVSESWLKSLEKIKNTYKPDAVETVAVIYGELSAFCNSYKSLFTDGDAARAAASMLMKNHKWLRRQLSELISTALSVQGSDFTAEFIAESVISWAKEGCDFEKLRPIVKKIVNA